MRGPETKSDEGEPVDMRGTEARGDVDAGAVNKGAAEFYPPGAQQYCPCQSLTSGFESAVGVRSVMAVMATASYIPGPPSLWSYRLWL